AVVYDKGIINIVEIMGRNAGFLAASSALANFDGVCNQLIYLPEIAFDMDKFLQDVSFAYDKYKKIVVAVSEGIRYSDGSFVFEDKDNKAHDKFGHSQMGGVGRILGRIVKEKICSRVKVIEFNVLQRCAMHFASKTDVEEAYRCGVDAVNFALNGESGKMVCINRINNNPYICETGLIDVSEVANKEKKFPISWITREGNNITKEGIEYLKPLIAGEVNIPTENGLPRFSRINLCL
ncbi:MAG: 6-phosphofructokinase, partial [Caloramator sp.]|nr:6-phosphofructokinase [Caloramator sp.]